MSARRLLPSESRKRAKNPARSSSASRGPSSSPSNSDQLRATADPTDTPRRASGDAARDRRPFLLGQPARDDLRDAVGAHRHAVEEIGRLDRLLLVSDHDELSPLGVAPEQLDEATDVRVVERGLDLVEQVDGTRPREK